MTPSTANQVAVEVETLRAFRDRVNGLLKSLDAGAGSSQSIGAQVIDPGHPGTGFQEVARLVARYQETHAKLVQLSQTLGNTIDAMTVSIDIARFGYENVNETELARLWQIHDAATSAEQSPALAQAGGTSGGTATGGGAPTNSGGTTGGGSSDADL